MTDARRTAAPDLGYVERLRLQRQLLDEMRALKARIDPGVLRQAQQSASALPADRRRIETAVALFLSARQDGGRLMRDIFAQLERRTGAPSPVPACGTGRR